MPRPATCLACALLALAAAWSLLLGGTVSAYTASTSTPSGSFVGASDWVAPTVSAAVIGRTTAYDTGAIAQGSPYYVYANATDTGNPASGIFGITANLNSISSGKTAVALTAGTYTAGGVSYGFRSVAETAGSVLAPGTDSFALSSTDTAANAGTQSFSTTVDNSAPVATDVQSANVSGGTVGHLDQGDTLTLTYSQPIDPHSVVAGWNGSSYSDVQVGLIDGGGTAPDFLVIYSADVVPVALPLGQINLPSSGYLNTGQYSYVEYGEHGAATPSRMVRSGSSITITLGTPSGTSLTKNTAGAMTWSPSSSVTDIAGNAGSTATATESGTHVNF